MIKTAIKHYIIDYVIENLFNQMSLDTLKYTANTNSFLIRYSKKSDNSYYIIWDIGCGIVARMWLMYDDENKRLHPNHDKGLDIFPKYFLTNTLELYPESLMSCYECIPRESQKGAIQFIVTYLANPEIGENAKNEDIWEDVKYFIRTIMREQVHYFHIQVREGLLE